MPWQDQPGGGFTAHGVEPWLPLGDAAAYNVESQQDQANSLLCLTRDLITLRKHTPDLQTGDYSPLAAPAGLWAWRRGQAVRVALNLSDAHLVLDGLNGHIVIADRPHV